MPAWPPESLDSLEGVVHTHTHMYVPKLRRVVITVVIVVVVVAVIVLIILVSLVILSNFLKFRHLTVSK